MGLQGRPGRRYCQANGSSEYHRTILFLRPILTFRTVQDTHKNETVLFSGPRAYTLSELADMITDILKLEPPLQLKVVSEDEFVASNEGGEDLLRKWATTFPALVRGELAVVDPLLQSILGREFKPFKQTVRETLGATGDGGDAAVKQYSRSK